MSVTAVGATLSVDEIRRAVREFLADHSGLGEVRAVADADADAARDGFDRPAWRRLATDLGVTALAVPDALGGLGLGLPAVIGALLEAGHELYPGPLRATASATLALLSADRTAANPSVAAALRAITDAAAVATLAGPVDNVRGGCGLSWDGTTLHGRARAVPYGAAADYLVAVVGAPGEDAALVLVEPAALAARTRRQRPGIDYSTPYADLDLEGAVAVPLTTDAALIEHILDLAQLLTAAEQVGLAQGALDRTLDYLRIREQFGRVIGGYQALQHRCADLVMRIEAVLALLGLAGDVAAADDRELLARIALLVRAEASEVALSAADTMLQLHGGIGFTWEHDTHLFFRRARSTAAWFGSPAQLRAEAVRRNCFATITRELGD
jgi:alkylation response protein AidB-like acyl-CoA dehydrogenase